MGQGINPDPRLRTTRRSSPELVLGDTVGRMYRMDSIQYNLPQSHIPQAWHNILPDLPRPLAPVLHPGTLKPIGPDDLAPLFPMSLILQEVSTDHEIEIPEEVRQAHAAQLLPICDATPVACIPDCGAWRKVGLLLADGAVYRIHIDCSS